MNIKIDITVCRVCLKSGDGKSLFSEPELGEKFKYVTQAKVRKCCRITKKMSTLVSHLAHILIS